MKRIIMCLGILLGVTLNCLCVTVWASAIPVGGITILKTDISGNPLEGATFQLVRELQDGELTDRTVEKKILKIGEENRIMALMPFWSDRAMSGEKQTEVMTNAGGNASIYGIPYGTYYLVEAKAPEGYNRITSPIRVAVHKYSHLTEADQVRDDQNEVIDNTLHIINIRYRLPDTGGLQTLQLAAAGTGILFSSVALLLVMNRKRW